MESKRKMFGKNFTLMVIGQIISLFGNTVLRFALPLYLYNQTGSSTLLGLVGAASFIPMILLSPVGGIVADRVNKRNIMVLLDFITAVVILVFTIFLGKVGLVPLITVTLMVLYGIQGSYQPAVQASLPALLDSDQLLGGNAIINAVNSLAGLIGPVVGGMLYGFYGLRPILVVSIVCFFSSAVMEIFIHIPFTRQQSNESVLKIAKNDLKQSAGFIRKERPVLGKAMLIIAAFNLFFTAMFIVGNPVVITKFLGFNDTFANQLYGYTQGIMAAGGLTGGLLTGILSRKIDITKGHILLLACAFSILPIAFILFIDVAPMVSYLVITACSFFSMACATMFSIMALAFVQQITPEFLIGKVISLVMAVAMCAQPLGQSLFGFLFDLFYTGPYIPMLFSAIMSFLIALFSKSTFSGLREKVSVATV